MCTYKYLCLCNTKPHFCPASVVGPRLFDSSLAADNSLAVALCNCLINLFRLVGAQHCPVSQAQPLVISLPAAHSCSPNRNPPDVVWHSRSTLIFERPRRRTVVCFIVVAQPLDLIFRAAPPLASGPVVFVGSPTPGGPQQKPNSSTHRIGTSR